MTERAPVLDLTNLTCPHCGRPTDDASVWGEADDEDRPYVGAPTICAYCAGTGIYTENSIRLPTEEEQDKLDANPNFQMALSAAEILTQLHGSGLIREGLLEIPGHEGHTHRGVVIAVGEGPEVPEGALDVHDLPDRLREAIERAVERSKIDLMAEEIRQYVTPEIAHHVLSAYGDEEATMPSMSVGLLISLIRMCNISDDDMLDTLNHIRDFHGYVLAICTMAEGPAAASGTTGMTILRRIAGLEHEGPVTK
jgi:hypothetical protein